MYPLNNSQLQRNFTKFWDQYKSTIYILDLRFILVPVSSCTLCTIRIIFILYGNIQNFGTNINPQFIYQIREVYWSQFRNAPHVPFILYSYCVGKYKCLGPIQIHKLYITFENYIGPNLVMLVVEYSCYGNIVEKYIPLYQCVVHQQVMSVRSTCMCYINARIISLQILQKIHADNWSQEFARIKTRLG